MPVFKVDIEQVYNNEYLTNIYHVLAADVEAAIVMAEQIVPIHRATLPTIMTMTRYRVSSGIKGDTVFYTEPINLNGTRSLSGTNMLPLFCRILVKFNVGFTYPNRKFLTGALESDSIDGGVPVATADFYTNNYLNPLIALGFVCSNKGILYGGGSIGTAIAMRQLRRASKRKTPVLA